MKKFFGFGSSTPPPPAPPSRPPAPPAKPISPPPAPAKSEAATASASKASPAATIVGRWGDPNGRDTTEFRADGTVTDKPASGETIQGRYSYEAGKLKIKLDAVEEEIVFTAAVSAEALETSDADGHVTRYRRL